MVKEGHDSTVRPKLQTIEFDNHRPFLDSWAADGKPMISRAAMSRLRAANVFLVCTLPLSFMLFVDWGEKEHVFSPVQRAARGWWRTFTEMDVADVAKGLSVGRPVEGLGGEKPRTSGDVQSV